MIKKFLIVLFGIVSFLSADFKHIDFSDMQNLGSVPVIDIRTPAEWKETGVIPGSIKLMAFDERGRMDIQSWLNEFSKYVKDKNQPFVLVCRTGSRTNTLGRYLNKMGYKNVYDLRGGITFGYLMKGHQTTKKGYTLNIFGGH